MSATSTDREYPSTDVEFEQCACYYGCDSRDEPAHQHADDPCPVHPDAPILG